MPVLARSVVVPRGQRRAAVILVATLAAATANVVLLLLALPHPRGPAVVMVGVPFAVPEQVRPVGEPAATAAPMAESPAAVALPPSTASAPIEVPTGFTNARRCPPPRRDAPPVTPAELDEAIDHVTVAPSNAGWIAAWSAEHLFVSTDAGAHFDRVLDGPGPITAVGFDCFGTVVAVRAQQLGLRIGSDERWQPVAGVELMSMGDEPEGHAAVVSGGPDVIVIGRQAEGWAPRIARSSDLGQHWRYHDVDTDWESLDVHGRQRDDGTIAISLPSTDCAGDGELRVLIRRGRIRTDTGPGLWPGAGTPIDVEPWPAGLPEGATWAGDGLARSGAELYRVRGDHATRLRLMAETNEYVADPAGRLWTVRCGSPVTAGPTASGVTCHDDGD